jgi:hypothetical protein
MKNILLLITQGLILGIAAMATFWANESFHAACAANVLASSAINLSNAQQLLSLQIQLVQYCESPAQVSSRAFINKLLLTSSKQSNSTSACVELLDTWNENIGSIAPALAAGNSTTLIQIMTPSARINTAFPVDVDPSGKNTGSIVGRFFVISTSGALGLFIFWRWFIGDLDDKGKF